MYKRIARFVGMSSIAILSAALVSVASAAPLSTAAPTEVVQPIVQSAESVNESDRIQARRAIVAALPPREYRSAVSKDAFDKMGYEKSLYRGKYYYKDQEGFRKCVMQRESRHNYRAANRVSSARGAYQFLDSKWRDGLVYMMLKESKKSDDLLNSQLKELFDIPIHKWNRYFQDRAFFTAMNFKGKWSGKDHWNATVPGTGC